MIETIIIIACVIAGAAVGMAVCAVRQPTWCRCSGCGTYLNSLGDYTSERPAGVTDIEPIKCEVCGAVHTQHEHHAVLIHS